MPTYDYRCKNCNDTFEHFQKMTDEPLAICDKCGGKLIRLIGTGLAPVFKGSGFYQTDYKKSNQSNQGQKGSSESISEKSNKKSEIKSDKTNTEKTDKNKKSA